MQPADALTSEINGEGKVICTGDNTIRQKRMLHDLVKDCSDSEDSSEPPKKTTPNGKKTKGRVKIKMEFIDNKLRRYTTFSKRKTGIMKKAYELSTLTGTQVMLLVASETGHVYTFATRKLQPMITSESGKALIQTCLNSPDPPVGTGLSIPDQRMSATGFEETELTYSVGDESDKQEASSSHLLYAGGSSPTPDDMALVSTSSLSAVTAAIVSSLPLPSPAPVVTTSTITTPPKMEPMGAVPTISMQLPQAAGFTTILAPGVGSGHTSSASPTLSRQNSLMVVPTSQQNLPLVSGNMVIPATAMVPNTTVGTVMYQTAQGLVYATPTTTALPEGVILNIGQPIQQENGNTTQQYITIPVPLSLATPQHRLVQNQTEVTGKASLNERGTSYLDISNSSKNEKVKK